MAAAPSDAFDLVLPSLPGYGFSGEPAEVGWDPARIARAWAALMGRLGYTPLSSPRAAMSAPRSPTPWAARHPRGWLGIHINLLVTVLAGPQPTETEQEHAAADAAGHFRTTGFGYFLEQATRPQTIGYALLDSPVALAAWMLDHDTDSYDKITRAFVDGQPTGDLTRDHIVDNVTLYWLTGTGASAARSYWESGRAASPRRRPAASAVPIPVGFTTFPDEIFQAPRSWVERGYPTLSYFHQADRGGHFAAWEEPDLFPTETPRRLQVTAVARTRRIRVRHPGQPDAAPFSRGAGGVEPKRLWDALQLHGTDLDEGHGPCVRRVDDLLTDQHLAGPGVLGDPRREVHGPAEVVTVLEDHRPRVDPHVRRWKALAPDQLHHLHGGQHGISGSRK